MSLLGIIPARGGSRGIKDKNIVLVSGKPLIVYTIEAALESGCFETVVVTSDDNIILDVASKYPVRLLKRPACLATDAAGSDGVIEHALLEMQQESSATHFMLLQPTSPLRSARDIQDAWKKYNEVPSQMLVSVYKLEEGLQKAFVRDEQGFLRGLLSKDAPFQRRQDLPDIFLPNGAIYICSKEVFMVDRRLPRERIFPYLMGIEESVDVDVPEDLVVVERYLKERGKNV